MAIRLVSVINLDGVPLDGASRRRHPAQVDAEYRALQTAFSVHLAGCPTCPSLKEVFEMADVMVADGRGYDDVMDVLGYRFCDVGKALVTEIGRVSWERGDLYRAKEGVMGGMKLSVKDVIEMGLGKK